jgi:hypothetical protein
VAQTSPVHALIQSLDNKRYEAVPTQDFDPFESLCHADLADGHTGGNRNSIKTYLDKLHRYPRPLDQNRTEQNHRDH